MQPIQAAYCLNSIFSRKLFNPGRLCSLKLIVKSFAILKYFTTFDASVI